MIKDKPSPISLEEIIEESGSQLRELKTVYDLLPPTKCQRQGRCCSLLPEMTFLEALSVIKVMRFWSQEDRINIIRKMVRYFFCNAVEINACPFLSGKDCLIYPDRFLGCRAYGLWSGDYYQELADQNRLGKRLLQQGWEALGISLPGEVLSFEVPYCSRVKTDPPVMVTDEMLSAVSERIDNLSEGLNPWGRDFKENYFSDLSFFLASFQFGIQEAVRLKFFIVQDIIKSQDRVRLEQTLSQVSDPF